MTTDPSPDDTPPFDNVFTDERIDKIRAYVKKWRVRLCLQGWRIHVIKGKKSMTGGNQAVVKMFLDARLTRFYVGDNCGNENCTDHLLETLVVHELLHIMFYEMKAFAADHGAPQHEDVLSAEHAVINVLEEILCPELTERNPNGNSKDS